MAPICVRTAWWTRRAKEVGAVLHRIFAAMTQLQLVRAVTVKSRSLKPEPVAQAEAEKKHQDKPKDRLQPRQSDKQMRLFINLKVSEPPVKAEKSKDIGKGQTGRLP
mgnify:CR=1 FL=1